MSLIFNKRSKSKMLKILLKIRMLAHFSDLISKTYIIFSEPSICVIELSPLAADPKKSLWCVELTKSELWHLHDVIKVTKKNLHQI